MTSTAIYEPLAVEPADPNKPAPSPRVQRAEELITRASIIYLCFIGCAVCYSAVSYLRTAALVSLDWSPAPGAPRWVKSYRVGLVIELLVSVVLAGEGLLICQGKKAQDAKIGRLRERSYWTCAMETYCLMWLACSIGFAIGLRALLHPRFKDHQDHTMDSISFYCLPSSQTLPDAPFKCTAANSILRAAIIKDVIALSIGLAWVVVWIYGTRQRRKAAREDKAKTPESTEETEPMMGEEQAADSV